MNARSLHKVHRAKSAKAAKKDCCFALFASLRESSLPIALFLFLAMIQEVSAADSPTPSPTPTSDELMSGMTIEPGAGDYLVVFSASVQASAAATIFASIYVGGVKQAHTEREHFQEASIAGTANVMATHAHVSVGAGQAVEIRWRASIGTVTITVHSRTMTLFPAAAANFFQASATADDTTPSTTDELMADMSLTPGAGDYLAVFSTSADGPSGAEINMTLYVGGVEVAHAERSNDQEASIPATEFVYFIAAKVSPTAAQAVEVRWRTSTGTATCHERTLTLVKLPPANIFEASATADQADTNTADALLNAMTVTPGAGDYLAIFSSSIFYGVISANQTTSYSLYVGGSQLAHTQRFPVQESSVDSADTPVVTHGKVSPTAAQAVELRWRGATTTSRTAHERTLVLVKEAAAAASLAHRRKPMLAHLVR